MAGVGRTVVASTGVGSAVVAITDTGGAGYGKVVIGVLSGATEMTKQKQKFTTNHFR